jgi:ATP-binding cassette subfamily C (CFTR/MRP) protein 1
VGRTAGDAATEAPAAPVLVDVLQNINVRIPKGHLTLVIGAVGSGKSSFLAGLLGEIKRTKGNVRLCGTLGYCHQQARGLWCFLAIALSRVCLIIVCVFIDRWCYVGQAWIQNASLRDNILFGLAYDEARYNRSIKFCALSRDLEVLPDGDLTEIGEKVRGCLRLLRMHQCLCERG